MVSLVANSLVASMINYCLVYEGMPIRILRHFSRLLEKTVLNKMHINRAASGVLIGAGKKHGGANGETGE